MASIRQLTPVDYLGDPWAFSTCLAAGPADPICGSSDAQFCTALRAGAAAGRGGGGEDVETLRRIAC
jgi:hypothetical protein